MPSKYSVWDFAIKFPTVVNINVASRIWDCYLLDGEVYAIKTGIALLKYFELELKMCTFEEAVKLLKTPNHDINENVIFNLIEKIDVRFEIL